MNDPLIFNIASLMDKEVGTSESYFFDGPVTFEFIESRSNIKGKAQIMRIDEGFNAKAEDFSLTVEFKCDRCLKKFDQEIMVKRAETQFYLEKPKEIDDIYDFFMVDKKAQTIDISEILRQEIILHFPPVSVCSRSCKGLCPVCGKDLNLKKCSHKPEPLIAEYKPLSKLKELLK